MNEKSSGKLLLWGMWLVFCLMGDSSEVSLYVFMAKIQGNFARYGPYPRSVRFASVGYLEFMVFVGVALPGLVVTCIRRNFES